MSSEQYRHSHQPTRGTIWRLLLRNRVKMVVGSLSIFPLTCSSLFGTKAYELRLLLLCTISYSLLRYAVAPYLGLI